MASFGVFLPLSGSWRVKSSAFFWKKKAESQSKLFLFISFFSPSLAEPSCFYCEAKKQRGEASGKVSEDWKRGQFRLFCFLFLWNKNFKQTKWKQPNLPPSRRVSSPSERGKKKNYLENSLNGVKNRCGMRAGGETRTGGAVAPHTEKQKNKSKQNPQKKG